MINYLEAFGNRETPRQPVKPRDYPTDRKLPNLRSKTTAMLKLMYFAIFISLTTLLACSGTEKSPPPTAVAQAPAAESILDPPPAPVETPVETLVEDPVPAEDPAQAESPIPGGRSNHSPGRRTDADRRALGNNSGARNPHPHQPERSGNLYVPVVERGAILHLGNRRPPSSC